MPNSNELLQDLILQRQIQLLKLWKRQGNEFVDTLDSTDKELVSLLYSELDSFTGSLTKTEHVRWNKLFKDIGKLRGSATLNFKSDYEKELSLMIESEIEFIDESIKKVIPFDVPTNLPVDKALNLIPYGVFDGKTINQWFLNFQTSDLNRIAATIRNSKLQGFTNNQIVSELIRKGGVLDTSRNNARTIVRTISNGISNGARNQYYNANKDIVNKVMFSAVLDGRTTLICSSRDGKIYKLEDAPELPLHPNCRSTLIPVIDGVKLIGNRPFIKDTRTRRVREIDFRKEAKRTGKTVSQVRKQWVKDNIGRTQITTSYEDWLKKQPIKFQEQVLGVDKAKLFNKGGLTLDKFIDYSNETLTLKDLKGRYKESFKMAGL